MSAEIFCSGISSAARLARGWSGCPTAIGFHRSLGAALISDGTVYRLSGTAV
jgi:hypothetical protein